MKAYYLKRISYLKDDKDVFLITIMYNDIVTNSLVDKKTYDWFDVAEIGDEIPSDFIKLNLYQTKDGIKATIKVMVD